MFSQAVTDAWFTPYAQGQPSFDNESCRIVVNPDVQNAHTAHFMTLPDGRVQILVGEQAAARIAPIPQGATGQDVQDALKAAGAETDEADRIHVYLPAALVGLREQDAVRVLTQDDAEAFARFEAAADPDELDEAYVELDHWCVMGVFDGDELVAATSAYPWRDSTLADIGVITHASHRRRGLAVQMVHAISREIVKRGYEPMYRAGVSNDASAGVALAAGMTRIGVWQQFQFGDGESIQQ